MLLAGHPKGVRGLDSYDAATVAWAMLDHDRAQTQFTFNPDGPQKLREQLLEVVPHADDMNAVAAMQAEMDAARAQSRSDAPQRRFPLVVPEAPSEPTQGLTGGVGGELAAMAALMGGSEDR